MSVRNIVPFPQGGGAGNDRDRRTAFEVAFLPAALEVMETPPSPTKRALVWIIIALFCLALGWAIVGSVDIIAIAQGRIVPSDAPRWCSHSRRASCGPSTCATAR